jgi:hypothetical protein
MIGVNIGALRLPDRRHLLTPTDLAITQQRVQTSQALARSAEDVRASALRRFEAPAAGQNPFWLVLRSTSPQQPALLRSALLAEPASHSLRLPVTVKRLPASTASCPPVAFGHIGLAAPLRPGSDFDALPLPDLVVPMAGANEGMGNLMKDGVPDLFPGVVSLKEVDGEFDRFTGVDAQPHGLLPAIEAECPVPEAMLGHQLDGELLGVPGTLGLRHDLSDPRLGLDPWRRRPPSSQRLQTVSITDRGHEQRNEATLDFLSVRFRDKRNQFVSRGIAEHLHRLLHHLDLGHGAYVSGQRERPRRSWGDNRKPRPSSSRLGIDVEVGNVDLFQRPDRHIRHGLVVIVGRF